MGLMEQPPSFIRYVGVLVVLLLTVLPASAKDAVLLRYAFSKGKAGPDVSQEPRVLHASPLAAGDGSLYGISSLQEQCFLLMRKDGRQIPTSREEALEQSLFLGFAVTPVENTRVTLHRLVFSVGAASVRLEGKLFGFARVQCGEQVFNLPVTFTRDNEGESEAFPIRKGDAREVLPGEGIVNLSQLPAPLNGPVNFQLYFYLSSKDLARIPEGTNYSIRIDNVSLLGEVQ